MTYQQQLILAARDRRARLYGTAPGTLPNYSLWTRRRQSVDKLSTIRRPVIGAPVQLPDGALWMRQHPKRTAPKVACTPASLAEIMEVVSRLTAVSVLEMHSHRRQRRLVRARWLYYWLARELTSCSFPQIGRHCGDRDHTTVLHGVQRVNVDMGRWQGAIEAAMRDIGAAVDAVVEKGR